ncbi:dihydroorotate dehydrogenase-like protein, partial [bacterium]|nr:dihydroorotate dehydrogenase-like protein [candidate division CSSED10-310 bacterium]
MTDLSTKYMGLQLKSPIIVGSCSLSKNIDNIIAAEKAGAGAIVIKSLFEEQLQMEAVQLESELKLYENMISEALSFHPDMEHGGTSEFIMWVKKARDQVSIPIIASLNAISTGNWVDYAVELADAGVDGLELNFFGVITDPYMMGREVLAIMVAILEDIKARVNLPVAVKLSPYLTTPAYAARVLSESGADALVLFNRFAQPDINIKSEKLLYNMVYSQPVEQGHTLRWIGLLSEKVKSDLCASTGIHTSDDVIKMILAGADSVQMVSAIMKHGISYISTLNEELLKWMKDKGYASLEDFRGKIVQHRGKNDYAFERSQYIKA